ncbi:MAG TPA: aldehyde dehydrogenase family protein, partial [Acidimicrobiales bacterium]|nr:aldehyde dehydrogenase family protein [Acidimicrobiales bacterium]
MLGRFAVATPDEVDGAVVSAALAQREWAKVPAPARAELIEGCGRVLAERKADLAALVSQEAGKILSEAGGDVQEAIDMAGFVAGQGRAAWGEVAPSELGSKLCWTTRQPVGVVGIVSPWNFPIAIPSWKVFPALLAGNGIVLKPSELAPCCATAFVTACRDAGIPADLINVVYGGGEVGARLVEDPGIRAISFTGSVPTGRRVAAAAFASGPRLVSLELGGKNAMVVLPDAELDLVTDGALFGAFGTAGQRCTSTSRLIVHRDVADAVVEAIALRTTKLVLGDPLDPATDVGPVISAEAASRIEGMVGEAVAEGASVAVGGKRTAVVGCDGGAFFQPTILTAVRPEHRIARQEVFGPVLAVIEVGSLDEAIEVVNGTEYGLSASVYTRDIGAALTAVDRIDTGIVYVNAPTIGAEIHLPFGGTRHTGNGFRDAGRRGLEQ